MSPTRNGSTVLRHFKHNNAVKTHNGIMFDFYPGLPHIVKGGPLVCTVHGLLGAPSVATCVYTVYTNVHVNLYLRLDVLYFDRPQDIVYCKFSQSHCEVPHTTV